MKTLRLTCHRTSPQIIISRINDIVVETSQCSNCAIKKTLELDCFIAKLLSFKAYNTYIIAMSTHLFSKLYKNKHLKCSSGYGWCHRQVITNL